jgi:hypothetical protein
MYRTDVRCAAIGGASTNARITRHAVTTGNGTSRRQLESLAAVDRGGLNAPPLKRWRLYKSSTSSLSSSSHHGSYNAANEPIRVVVVLQNYGPMSYLSGYVVEAVSLSCPFARYRGNTNARCPASNHTVTD